MHESNTSIIVHGQTFATIEKKNYQFHDYRYTFVFFFFLLVAVFFLFSFPSFSIHLNFGVLDIE